ncbi:alpha/beta hydrolase [Prochlorococcus sp. MIT 1341]|uniref:alpha/beta hydrolase n=1 Tax=Prochlorococcus sp. MIT 1341 TaxID=3096221 RepID=UPI002A76514E|nr:alpha/beta fold hydrolase [Prochlorococcus sp. MIT 1341]
MAQPNFQTSKYFAVIADLFCNSPDGATRRLVLLHGWGADVDDLIPLGKSLLEGIPFPVELIALRAPHNHSSGYGRQWYGLFPPDWDAVPEAVEELSRRLLDLETIEISLSETILLGFSQGGAMAIATGSNLPLAGIISCSGYPHPGWSAKTTMPPVVVFHGKSDDVVPPSAAELLIASLVANQIANKAFLFDGGHGIPDEITPQIQEVIKSLFVGRLG